MATLLIAVGGTGQHLALAVSRLVFLGALPEMELAVIDADNVGELSVALKTFGGTLKENYTEHPLEGGDIIYPPFKDVHGNPQFQQLFLDETPSPVERDVFEVCVDRESAGFEVKKGMFGRPSLGAAIFADNRETTLHEVIKKARGANPVFVAGSLVGGTGAGIMHQLVKSVAAQAGVNKELYGLVFLRWFRIPGGEVEQTVDDATQERNMRYGLDYFFRETRSSLKAALLIGQPSDLLPVEARPGETRHAFHLIAAHGILKVPEDTVKQQAAGSIYAAAFDPNEPELQYDEEWKDGQRLRWYVNRANYVKAALDYASSDKFRDEVESIVSPGMLGGVFGRGNPENIGAGLADALGRYPKAQRQTAIRVVTETWALISRQYKFSLDWLDDVLRPLPDEAQDKSAKEGVVERLKKVWAEVLPVWQTPPPPAQVAHEFHRKLTASYEREK